MVSPAAILMLTSSLSSNFGSLGKCLRHKHYIFFKPHLRLLDASESHRKFLDPYLRRTSLSWLAAQMVSSRAQDSSALV